MSWFTQLIARLPDPNRLPPGGLPPPPPPAMAGDDAMESHCADLRAMLRLQRMYRDHLDGVLRAPDFQPNLARTMSAHETPLTRREYRRMATFLRGESSRAVAHIEAFERALGERCGQTGADLFAALDAIRRERQPDL